jgi:hypothetical protein
MRRSTSLLAILLPAALCVACSDDTGPGQPLENGTIVTGTVTAIQNDIPVDGGILLDIDVADDGSDRLVFPSLFTPQQPSEETLRLYDVVRRVEVGDVVRAEGAREQSGLLLQKLWILDGTP